MLSIFKSNTLKIISHKTNAQTAMSPSNVPERRGVEGGEPLAPK